MITPHQINYITPGGLKRLQDEYNDLSFSQRPSIVAMVKWAASLGDRSENADYQYGKKKLREIDRRLRFLDSRLKNIKVINPEDLKSHKIQFGACVRIMDIENEYEKVVFIVGVDETSPSDGRISWQSPLGRSLIGKELGDIVIVKAPRGELEYEINHIEYKKINIPPWEKMEALNFSRHNVGKKEL